MVQSVAAPLLDEYFLRAPDEILDKLRLLQKRDTLVSVVPAGSQRSFTSTIVKLIPERKLMALSEGADPVLNKLLVEQGGGSFSAAYNGIDVRFEAQQISEASLNGQDVFAVPIPQALYWLQRRSFFRVPIPYSQHVSCRIDFPDLERGEFDVVNLSLLGLAVVDRSGRFKLWGRIGQTVGPCNLAIPGFDDERFGLEIRNKLETSPVNARQAVVRVGFTFQDVSRSFEVRMQKYMYDLERELQHEKIYLRP